MVGGPGQPEGLDTGYFVKPTVFAHVTNDMTIAREEIFGPVLVMIGYDDDDDAVRIANDTAYGLSGLVSPATPTAPGRWPAGSAPATCTSTARRSTSDAPFGGYKQSGNGREWGELRPARSSSRRSRSTATTPDPATAARPGLRGGPRPC